MNADIMQAIVVTAEYYGRQLSEPVLRMYTADLSDLPPHKVLAGYAQYRRNPANRTFPLPAQIRELVNPEEFVAVEAQAREIAARVVGAVPKFGWNNVRGARSYIGEIGWGIVERQGGWQHICENLGTRMNATTFQAQVRDQADSSIRYGTTAIEQKLGALPEAQVRRSELTPVLDMTKFLPEPEGEGA